MFNLLLVLIILIFLLFGILLIPTNINKTVKADTFNILRESIPSLISKHGLYETANIAKQAFLSQQISMNQCHILFHQIGHEAYAYYQREISKIMNIATSVCWDSYEHGLEGGIVLGSNNVFQDLKLFCDQWKIKYPNSNCYHGAGHGFLEKDPYNLSLALTSCDHLIDSSQEDKDSCYRGVFSELGNRSVNYDGGTGKYIGGTSLNSIDHQQVLKICLSLDHKYQLACASQLTKVIYHDLEINNALIYCLDSVYPTQIQHLCIRSLGLFYADDLLSHQNQVDIPSGLINLPKDYRRSFILGAKSVFITLKKDGIDKDLDSFCDSLLLEDRDFCRLVQIAV